MNKDSYKSIEEYREEINKQLEVDKQNYKGPFCCLIMDYNIDKSNLQNKSSYFYVPKLRCYYLQPIIGFGSDKIDFCPHCGIKLPQELSDLWFDILEKEYGIDSPFCPDPEDEKKFPAEFLTDKWWINRKL